MLMRAREVARAKPDLALVREIIETLEGRLDLDSSNDVAQPSTDARTTICFWKPAL